jgi:hypothetical protein
LSRDLLEFWDGVSKYLSHKHLSHNVYCKKIWSLYKALQYQFEPDCVYTVRINWGLRVDKSVVFTQLSQRELWKTCFDILFKNYTDVSRVVVFSIKTCCFQVLKVCCLTNFIGKLFVCELRQSIFIFTDGTLLNILRFAIFCL